MTIDLLIWPRVPVAFMVVLWTISWRLNRRYRRNGETRKPELTARTRRSPRQMGPAGFEPAHVGL